MKSGFGHFVAMGATLALAVGAQAQIVWSAPQSYTGADSDISTRGTFVAAVYENNSNGTSPITVTDAGTVFDHYTDAHITGIGGGGSDGSHSTATPYQQALDGVAYTYVPGTSTFTLAGLNAADRYQVEIWDVDSSLSRTTQFSSTGAAGTTTSAAVYQGFVLGTLSGVTSQTITFQGTMSGGVGEVNAVALRDLGVAPEPSTYALLLGGLALLGFALRRGTLASR